MSDNDWVSEQKKQEIRDEWFDKTVEKFRNPPAWVEKGADILSAVAMGSAVILFATCLLWLAVKILGSLFT